MNIKLKTDQQLHCMPWSKVFFFQEEEPSQIYVMDPKTDKEQMVKDLKNS